MHTLRFAIYFRRGLQYLFITVLLLILPVTLLLVHTQQTIQQHASGGLLHVMGSQLVDANGNPVLLRGAMMESSFAYINQWKQGKDPLAILNSNTFNAMHSWGMNTLRINISNWIYDLDPTTYMNKLDTAVGQANQAGLYVILDFHDDTQSGSPYGDSMLHTHSIAWWKTLAAHYQNNGMVMFDLINEPKYPNWTTWAHGGGDIVGILDMTSAIRLTGANQVIIYEPGKAGGTSQVDAGWATFDPSIVTDPNIMYSRHEYEKTISGNPGSWDLTWGKLLGKAPIYYGEWSVLANAAIPAHCQGLTSSNADQVINTFLNYLDSRHANWTYWDFEPYRLIMDYTSFTPTSYATGAPWVCPSGTQAGGGSDVKKFLATHGGPPPSSAISPSTSTSPTPAAVTIQNMQFIPHGQAVPIGTTVTWTNNDTLTHTVTSDLQTGPEVWDSGPLAPGQSFSRTFQTPGQYAYHCKIHPFMTGFIEVFKSTSQTPTTTVSPSPSISPGSTVFSLSICPHGMGNCGDNVNPSSGGNTSPVHQTRNVTLNIGTGPTPLASVNGTVSYNTTSQNYQGTIPISNLASGSYLIWVKMDEFLSQTVSSIISVTSGQPVSLPVVSEVTGDVNNDNQIDLLDYNIIISCFGAKMSTSSCTAPPTSQSPGADINDDGVVDGVDYNLFLRELSVQKGQGGGPSPTPTPSISTSSTPTPTPTGTQGQDIHKIKHIVIIMQENRSYDTYFGTYPGGEDFPSTYCVPNPTTGHCVKPFHLTADMNNGGPHMDQNAINDIDNGKMDGFIKSVCPSAPGCSTDTMDVMGYKERSEIPNYWSYADNFVLQDHMFQALHTWSHPTHIELVSGWSALCTTQDPMSCTSNLDLKNIYTNHAWTDVTYLLHKNNISWAYYLDHSAVPQIWNPLPGFNDVTSDNQQGNVTDLTNFFTALNNNTVPQVSWIMPKSSDSEHPTALSSTGEAYVTNIINQIMQSSSWSSTAIFLTWDDWGGFFDHLNPPQIDVNGYGIRVPGLVISPYAKKGFIDKQTLSFDAYLKFIEDDFLNSARLDPKTDGRPDSRPDVRENIPGLGDLTADFDFTQSPRPPLVLALNNKTKAVAGIEKKSFPWWYSIIRWVYQFLH